MLSPLPNAKTRMVPVKEVPSYSRQALLRPLLSSLVEIPPPGIDESLRNHQFGGGSPCHVCVLHLSPRRRRRKSDRNRNSLAMEDGLVTFNLLKFGLKRSSTS